VNQIIRIVFLVYWMLMMINCVVKVSQHRGGGKQNRVNDGNKTVNVTNPALN